MSNENSFFAEDDLCSEAFKFLFEVLVMLIFILPYSIIFMYVCCKVASTTRIYIQISQCTVCTFVYVHVHIYSI